MDEVGRRTTLATMKKDATQIGCGCGQMAESLKEQIRQTRSGEFGQSMRSKYCTPKEPEPSSQVSLKS
jgi:hypothetical protein